MKPALIALAILCLTGCAGLQTTWRLQLQMIYMTPDDAPPAPPPAPPVDVRKQT
jgi:hypothetical protein